MRMVFTMKKVLECLRVMEGVDLGTKRPSTHSLEITEFIVVEIGVVKMEEVDIYLKTSHSSFINHGAFFHVYRRGGYMYQTRNSSSHNQGFGRFSGLPFSSHNVDKSVHGDERCGYMYQTIHSSSHNPGGCSRLLGLSVASRSVEKVIHGDDRGDISFDDGRRGFRSQETSYYYFQNRRESVDVEGRCGDRSQTTPSPYHNTYGHGRLLGLSIDYCPVQKIVHCDNIGDSSINYGRGGYRSQVTIHYHFNNCGVSVDVDGRGKYRSQTRHSTPHNSGGICQLLVLSVYGDDRGGHRYQTSHLPSHNHGEIYSVHPRFPQDAFTRGLRGGNIQNIHQ